MRLPGLENGVENGGQTTINAPENSGLSPIALLTTNGMKLDY
jgi:hypothetical protein